jgi:hypothetical protein
MRKFERKRKSESTPKKEIIRVAAAQKFSQLASSCEVQVWLRSTWHQYVYSVNPTCQQLTGSPRVPGPMLTSADQLQLPIRFSPFGGVIEPNSDLEFFEE